MPSPHEIDEMLTALFRDDPKPVPHHAHPSDQFWRAYLTDALPEAHGVPMTFETMMERNPDEWPRRLATTHLFCCPRCRDRVMALRRSEPVVAPRWQWLNRLGSRLAGSLTPMPRPVAATVALQLVIIAGLAAMLFVKPSLAPFSPATESSPQVPSSQVAVNEASTLPAPVVQAISTLSSSSNPQQRLSAAQTLTNYPDPRLIQPLTRAYQNETDQDVRSELAKAMGSVLTDFDDQVNQAAQVVSQVQQNNQQLTMMEQLSQQIAVMLQQFNQAAPDFARPYQIRCSGPANLTLGQLASAAAGLSGQIQVEATLTPGSFTVRLPNGIGTANAINQLQSRLGVTCRP